MLFKFFFGMCCPDVRKCNCPKDSVDSHEQCLQKNPGDLDESHLHLSALHGDVVCDGVITLGNGSQRRLRYLWGRSI